MEQTQATTPIGFQQLTQKIRPLISTTADTVCRLHLRSFLDKSIEYISSAVWSADRIKELDDLQIEISRICGSVEHELFTLLDFKWLTSEQNFAMYYFMRELLLVKICFGIELAKQYSCQLLETAGET